MDNLSSSDPRVLLLHMGGTVSAKAADALDLINYSASGEHFTAAEMCAFVQALPGMAPLIPLDLQGGDSASLAPLDWCELSSLLHRELAHADVAGAVILHGTSTLEEAAYVLLLTLKHAKPVILTGAQRPLNTIGSDAITNVRAAVASACDRRLGDYGPVVVMNGDIHLARDVEKSGTYACNAFRSRGSGPIGRVDPDNSIVLRTKPVQRATNCPPLSYAGGTLPRVDIVVSFSGADGAAINASVAAGAAAIIHCGLSPGMATPDEAAAIVEAGKRGVIVIQSCYGTDGPVLRTYQTEQLASIPARDLSPKKARLLAMMLIASGMSKSAIEEAWDCF